MNSPATPPYADFPTAEYTSRVTRAQQLMRDQGIDVMLLAQRENVEYFSGFLTGHWVSKTFATAVVLLHRNQDPILVIPEFFGGNADKSSWITDRVMFPE
jgi:Xaa-Pro aminopeptidase